MPQLTVETKREPESVLISLVGTLESATLDQAEQTLQWAVSEYLGGVILNLYECEYIDRVGVQRLLQIKHDLQEQDRFLGVYVRPLSYVSHRLTQIPIVRELPPAVVAQGEERLAKRRSWRLARWSKEKPIQPPSRPGMPTPATTPPPGGELLDLDFAKVSSLADKDERVVRQIWEVYNRILEEGGFPPAPDGTADTQLSMDSRKVARELRLHPDAVRKVIESVSTQLGEVFQNGSD